MKAPALLLIALLAPAAAQAATANFPYDYVDLGRLRVLPDGSPSGSGPSLDLSYTLIDGIQFRGSYASLKYPAGVSYKDYTAGFSGEEPFTATTDVYTDLLYINDRYEQLGSSVSDDGYRLAIGLRHHPWGWERLEFDGYLAHNYLNTSVAAAPGVYLPQSSNELGIGALFDVTPWLSLGFTLARDSNQAQTTDLKLRLYF